MSDPVMLRPTGRGGLTTPFWRELAESLRHPEFWAVSSWLDLVVRHRKSSFGVIWLLAPSLVYVWGFGYFFASQMGRSIGQYSAHIALGAMIFRTLMSAVVESATVFSGSRSFIMDGHMRLTDYLLESLAKAFFNMCTFLPVTVVALAMYPDLHLAGLLWLPVSTFVVYLNAFWITVVFSLFGSRFPDFSQFIGNTSIFIFMLTPIIWYPESMPAHTLRGQLMRFNPFYHLVSIFRAPVLGDQIETVTYYYVAIMTVVGIAVAALLYRRYARFVPLWI